jgi:polar amino acid transport system substrate-binding protein
MLVQFSTMGRLLALVATLAFFLYPTSSADAQVTPPKRFADKGSIIFCTDLSYPPWALVDTQTMQPSGVEIEFSDAIAKTMGLKAEHKNIQFDGLIPATQAGQCDAIISTLIDKPARREVLDFVDYAMVGNVIIVPAKSDIFVQDLTGLSGQKVVVQSGSQLEQDLIAANDKIKAQGRPEMKIVTLPNNTDAMQQLFSGLVDAYYAVPEQASYFNSQRPNSVKLGSPTLGARPVGIATAKKDHDLYEAIAAAFKELQANGQYDAIFSKAGLQSLEIKD